MSKFNIGDEVFIKWGAYSGETATVHSPSPNPACVRVWVEGKASPVAVRMSRLSLIKAAALSPENPFVSPPVPAKAQAARRQIEREDGAFSDLVVYLRPRDLDAYDSPHVIAIEHSLRAIWITPGEAKELIKVLNQAVEAMELAA